MADDQRPPRSSGSVGEPTGPGAPTGPGTTTAQELPPPAPTPGTGDAGRFGWLRSGLGSLVLPILAIISALLVGAFVIILSDQRVLGLLASDPLNAIGTGLATVANAYGSLIRGAIGDPVQLLGAVVSLDGDAFVRGLRPISETILSSTPIILTGLAVALAFRAGLFNIGAEGQFQIGALLSVFVGFSLVGLPWFVHLPLALAAGFVGGALWAFVPGLLKARTGAHEVITTIMLNFVAFRLVEYLLKTPVFQREGRADPVSKIIEPTAALAPIVDGLRAHWGIAVALLAAAFVSWLLFRSTTGFEFRAVGLNPFAARYAGMSISLTVVASMAIAGGLAGVGGATIVLGATRTLTPGIGGGAGFDGIAIALLGRGRPLGVVAAAFLIGALRAGATPMQSATGIPIHLVVVIQALVIMFIAAPALVRAIYRIRAERATGTETFAKGWGA